MNGRKSVLLALAMLAPARFGWTQAEAWSDPPAPEAFRQRMPENASTGSVRTVDGGEAVRRLRESVGLEAVGLLLARFAVVDPLDRRGAAVRASFRQRSQVLAMMSSRGLHRSMTSRLQSGDAIAETWRAGGWNYSATYTWNGSHWELTAFASRHMQGGLPTQ